MAERVPVCKSCYDLGAEGITLVREKREMAALKHLLDLRLKCSECSGSLPRGRRRWWICDMGRHECHFAGHEVSR